MTRMLRTLIAPALALVAFTTTANADYSFSVTGTPTFGSALPFGVSIATPTGTIGDAAISTDTLLTFTYTPSAATTGSTSFTFSETFTGTPGTEVVQFSGTFQFVSTTASVFAGYQAVATVISGSGYTVPSLLVNYFNNSGTTGSVQATVIPAAVPEPASIAMLGMGLVGSLGFVARRRLARA